MGIGDKLKFWKKEEEDFSDLGDFGLGDFGAPSKPAPGAPPGGAGPGAGMASEEDIFGKGFGEDFGAGPAASPEPAMGPPTGTPSQPGAPQGGAGMAQPTFPSATERMETASPVTPPPPARPQPAPPQYGYAPSQPETFQRETYSKDIEVISAKLDSMRATLESINQRLANLERLAQGEQQSQRRYEW